MRVLSIPQPFAQLVVRGVKRLEVRGWGTDFRGRIAIHASSAVPSREIMRTWKTDRDMALRFADQGWLDREDLKALPRSAIVGTVELVGVHLGKEVHHGNTGLFAWNWLTDQMEVAAPNPRTGELEPIKARRTLLPVPTPDDEYAWVFIEPVEIDPITGVDGRQNLWHLVGELEGVTADREHASRKGWWRAPEVQPSRRAKGIRAWREHWLSEREQFVRDVEARVASRREMSRIRFAPEFERQVQADMALYVKRHRVAVAAGSEEQVRVESRMRYLFDNREVVGTAEFELTIRRRLKKQADERRAAEKHEKRRKNLFELLDQLRKGAGARTSEQENIRVRLEVALDKMLDEEEEDVEHERREAYPDAADKAARGAARVAARMSTRPRPLTPDEKRSAVDQALLELFWALAEDEAR